MIHKQNFSTRLASHISSSAFLGVTSLTGLRGCARLSAVIVVLLVFVPVASGLRVFDENWDAGIDASKWHSFGWPAPSVYTGPLALGDGSFTTNGDSWYSSGVVTAFTFEIVPHMEVTVRSRLHAGGVQGHTPWQSNAFYFSTAPLSSFGDSVGDIDLNYKDAGFLIWHHGDARPNLPWPENGKISYGFEPKIDGLNRFDAQPTFDQWVKFTTIFEVDGSVSYYRDGVLNYRSPVGTVDYGALEPVRLVIGGRTVSSLNLVDDVSILVIPEPSSMALSGIVGIWLLSRGRRRCSDF